MNIIENIKSRSSLRTYNNEALRQNDKDLILQFIKELKQPLNGNARIELVSKNNTDNKAVKLGTYGVISGANDYLLLIYEDGVLAQENAGYMFEEVVLYCTSLGLGTCWLGGTFNRNDFKDNVQMSDKEKLPIVSPVGYPKEKRSFLDKMMRSAAKSTKRKAFEEVFFHNDFKNPLTQDIADKYFTPLEMVRIAPSASNSQPWRIILQEYKLHFYDSISNRFSSNDLGIALCHFNETCKELNISGKLEMLDEKEVPSHQKMKYTISWIAD